RIRRCIIPIQIESRNVLLDFRFGRTWPWSWQKLIFAKNQRHTTMRKLCFLLILAPSYAIPARAKIFEPLIPVQTIDLPDVPEGPYTDHLCVDTKGHRLFTTMQAQKAVAVIDLDNGKVLRNIPVGNPHSCAYRSDLDHLYVADGDPTQPGLKVFSARDYH